MRCRLRFPDLEALTAPRSSVGSPRRRDITGPTREYPGRRCAASGSRASVRRVVAGPGRVSKRCRVLVGRASWSAPIGCVERRGAAPGGVAGAASHRFCSMRCSVGCGASMRGCGAQRAGRWAGAGWARSDTSAAVRVGDRPGEHDGLMSLPWPALPAISRSSSPLCSSSREGVSSQLEVLVIAGPAQQMKASPMPDAMPLALIIRPASTTRARLI